MTTNNRSPSTATPNPTNPSTYRGAHSNASIREPRNNSANRTGSTCAPGSPNTNVPPEHNARTTSPVNTSNPAAANDNHRYRAPPGKCATDQPANTDNNAPCDTRLAFGQPDEPDVNTTHANPNPPTTSGSSPPTGGTSSNTTSSSHTTSTPAAARPSATPR
nr:hypothetical protein [Dactylosporangium siamense]